MEAYWLIELIEQYYTFLRQVYKVIMKDLQSIITKKRAFQLGVQVVNNITGLNSLVPTLHVFRFYSYIQSMDLPTLTIIYKATAIQKAIE